MAGLFGLIPGHAQSTPSQAAPDQKSDPRTIFERGQTALQQGHLAQAEADFRTVLSIDPNSTAAYANLGVVYMRQKHWKSALAMLEKAEQLSPGVPGIKLNIGWEFNRKKNFRKPFRPFRQWGGTF